MADDNGLSQWKEGLSSYELCSSGYGWLADAVNRYSIQSFRENCGNL